jgi:L-arabinose transport system substrate-binding protein
MSASVPWARLRGFLPAAVLSLVLAIAACTASPPAATPTSPATPTAPPAATEPATPAPSPEPTGPTIGYIQCHGDQQYFVDQAHGAREAAQELGVDLLLQDYGDDTDLAVTQLDTLIAAGIEGVAFVACDTGLGPVVIEKADNAGIPLLASDVIITDADDNPAPFVGFDGVGMGTKVGEEAVRLYQESGWADDPSATVRVLNVEWPELGVCTDRTDASKQVFSSMVSDFDPSAIIDVPYDGTSARSLENVATTITANPTVTHWLIWSCNDDGVQGAIRALENAGVARDNVIGVGLGADLACQEWAAGVDSMFRSALYISGVEVGKAAVRALFEAVTTGNPLPANSYADTTMVNPDTYIDAGVDCQ